MAPTDVVSLVNQPVVAAQALREAGFEVDMQSMDWQSVVQRRAQQAPVGEGGWNMFFTNWMVPEISDPLTNVMVNGRGDDAWFGWPDGPGDRGAALCLRRRRDARGSRRRSPSRSRSMSWTT